MDTNFSGAVIVLALSKHNEAIIRLTLVSQRSYASTLQEAMGLGQRFLKSELEVVRVEIYDERVAMLLSGRPLAILTKDDLLQEQQELQRMHLKWLFRLAQCFTLLIRRLRPTSSIPAEPLESELR